MYNFNSLSSPSFYIWVHKIGKGVTVEFYYYQVLNGELLSFVKQTIESGYCYLAIIRVKYGENQYYTAGNSFGFKYDDENNEDNLIALFINICDNLKEFFKVTVSGRTLIEDDEEIDYFEIIFRQIDSKFLSDIRLDKNSLIHMESANSDLYNKQVKQLPLTIDKEIIGNLIKDVRYNNGKYPIFLLM